jgi:hypothetical protein
VQQRLALLGLLAELAHVVEEFFDVLLLLGDLTGLRLVLQALGDVAFGGLLVFEGLADLLLRFGGLLSLLAKLLHLVGEFLAGLLAEVLLHLLQFALRARGGVGGVGELLFL